MLAHRLKDHIVPHVGRQIYCQISPLRRNPETAEHKVAGVADQLGVPKQDAKALVLSGVLKTVQNGRGEAVVKGPEIDRFVKDDLQPTELFEKPIDPSAAVATSPAQPAAPAATDTRPRRVRAVSIPPPADDDAPDAQTEVGVFEADCPNCRAGLKVADGVLAAQCPRCGTQMAFGDVDEADDDEPPAAKPGFINFLFGPRD
jgi:hypothetical protein